MVQQTSNGIVYPESTDNTRLWEHFLAMANSINPQLNAPAMQVYEADDTWSKPSNLKWVLVRCQADGGGSGGCASTGSSQTSHGGGGGGGEYAESLLLASSLGATENVLVGQGGAGGLAGANSGSQGDGSSFGSLVIATPGNGGVGGNAVLNSASGGAAGGAGGTGGTGQLLIPGSAGGNTATRLGSFQRFGHGGGSFMSTPLFAEGSVLSGSDGDAGLVYGGGAAGSWNYPNQGTARAGAAGAPGVLIVVEFF